MNIVRKRTFIGVAVLLICLIALSVFALWYISFLSDVFEGETEKYLSEISIQGASTLNEVIEGDLEVLLTSATFLGSQDGYDMEQTFRILYKENERNAFKRMGMADLNGNVMSTDNESFNISDRDYYQRSLKGESVVSKVMVDKTDGNDIIVYSTPVYNDDKVKYVVFATMNVSMYKKSLEIFNFGDSGYSFIIDSDGSAVISSSHPNSNKNFKNIFEEEMIDPQYIQQMRANLKKGRYGIANYDKTYEEKFAGYAPIGINDWYIVSTTPRDMVTAKTNMVIMDTAIIGAGIITVFAILLMFIFLTQSRRRKELQKAAYIDMITGGYNFSKFSMDVQSKLNSRKDNKYAMIVFDIDKFKSLNEYYGIERCNLLLEKIWLILKESVHADDVFARTTADNFAVLYRIASEEDVVYFINGLLERIREKCETHNNTFSFGIRVIVDDEMVVNSICDKANLAKYSIKSKHGDNYAFYDERMIEAIQKEDLIERDMHLAIKNNEFLVYYQPKYNINNGRIVGAEALVRWKRKGVGIVPPLEFLPVFEKNGFVTTLDMHVLEQVCSQLRDWIDAGHIPMPISVNFSRLHLENHNFVTQLKNKIDLYKISSDLVELELTENIYMENTGTLFDVIEKLRDLGFVISMDDFGSGYSSLGLLKSINVDVLKLDREFLVSSIDETRARKVISNIVTLAKDLEIRLVAEGVETKEQVEFLKAINCDIVQGYYYAKPMELSEFQKLLLEQEKKDIVQF